LDRTDGAKSILSFDLRSKWHESLGASLKYVFLAGSRVSNGSLRCLNRPLNRVTLTT